MADDLKQKMIGTLAWTTIDRFGQQIIQFVIGIVLARLLSPAEYTLIALVMIFVALSNTLVDGGFGQALVRKLDANDTDFSTVFYFNVFVSVCLYLLLYFLAPLIADFYNQPKLVEVARVVFIAILVNSLYLIPNVKLIRKLDLKSNTVVNIISVILSGITGIILAIKGMGVWALVAQQVSFQITRVIVISCFVRWKPKFKFSFLVLQNFFSYGMNLLGTTILNNIFSYIYILVLGKFFPKQEVGLYYQANKLNETTNYSFQVVLSSTYNVFVKIQDDTDRFLRVFRELVRRSSVIIFPLLLLLIAIANPLINVLLSAKWAPAIPYFQLLCLASLSNPLYTLIISALNARGKSKNTFRIEFIKKALIIISVLVCLKYGIIALLIGFSVANWLSALITIFAIKREINHYWKNQLKDILPSIFIGIVIAIVSTLMSLIITNLYFLLISQLFVSMIVYITMVKLLLPELFSQALNFVQSNVFKPILKYRYRNNLEN